MVAPLNASQPGARPAPPVARDRDAAPPRGPQLVEELLRRPVVPSSTPAPAPADLGPSFAAALDAARSQGGAYGVAFAVVRDGAVAWAGASGRARDGRTDLSPGSALVIGSATKTFVAAAVLQLVDEGLIGLDDPVREHLPQLEMLSAEITVEQLLDHTSGLADLFNDTTRQALEDDPTRPWVASEVLASLGGPWYQPGEGWAYANTNYYLLGMVVEAVTGSPLADELSTRFIDPLGLTTTQMLVGGEDGAPLSEAWASIFWGSGAMSASATDLARWGDALYGGGLLSPESQAAMLGFNSYDYGLGVQRLEVGGVDGYGHTGLLSTYTTLLFHVPERRATIALLVNRSHVDLAAMLAAEPPGGPSLLELALGD